jgi:YggT family protein
MDITLIPLARVLAIAINIFWWAIVMYVFLGWLGQFGVIHRNHKFIYRLYMFLFRIIEPALVPIRSMLPRKAGVDLSPLVLILVIYFGQKILFHLIDWILQGYAY